MNLFANIDNIYFAGIGGIGMSALARYFLAGGYNIAGYDRLRSELTEKLSAEGCIITYQERINEIPQAFRSSNTIVIFTPAIPSTNIILNHFMEEGYHVYKRAAILGIISEHSRTIAIAGTHGKTTITTLAAHLIKQSTVDCTAFLGGISKNYNSNLILGQGEFTVMEADEYDRSFHTLTPELALITSMDPDHLEVYGNHEKMIEAYNTFAARIRKGGKLVVNSNIRHLIRDIEGVTIFTYGSDEGSDFSIGHSAIKNEAYHFEVKSPFGTLEKLVWTIPGKPNLQNAVAGISLALFAGVDINEIRKSLLMFKGVERRFDVRLDTGKIIFIDDYAHHPEELNFLIDSVIQFYGGKKISAAFQPHLFSRTRDHAPAFARSLDRLHRVFLLPVYPAREEPVEGVTSSLIFDNMTVAERALVTREELLEELKNIETDIFITIGAGDIDRLVEPVRKLLEERNK